MNIQKAQHPYVCIPEHPEAVKRFEFLMTEWAVDLSEDILGCPTVYPDMIFEDIFLQRDMFDFQTDVAMYKTYGEETFPINRADWSVRQEQLSGEMTIDIESEFRIDIMLFLNRRHLFYAIGMKDEKTGKVNPFQYYNSPFKEVW